MPPAAEPPFLSSVMHLAFVRGALTPLIEYEFSPQKLRNCYDFELSERILKEALSVRYKKAPPDLFGRGDRGGF